jgi:hypothetical protein
VDDRAVARRAKSITWHTTAATWPPPTPGAALAAATDHLTL